jgi:glycosyltransferase involved in cell wall biosynthesis
MKVLFIAPHLSTGGMPAFLLKRIQALQQYTDWEIHVIEWKNLSPDYIVQKTQIQKLVGDNFTSYNGDLEQQKGIVDYCKKNKIDIIHIEEIPEGFDGGNEFNIDIQKELYKKKHPWKVVETCHNIFFNPDESKVYEPDGYACVTPHHIDTTFKNKKTPKSLITFPIDPSISPYESKEEILSSRGWLTKGEFHIVNVGLWTPGKNQGYAVKLAKQLWEKYRWTYIFHFVGNQAPNFSHYWEPIMEEGLPPNVFIHGEQADTDYYMKMSDLMLFTSTWECNPIVLKEAISNNIKIMAFDLDHYGEEYVPFIIPLTGNQNTDYTNLIDTIHSPLKYNDYDIGNNVRNFAKNHINFYNSLLDEK